MFSFTNVIETCSTTSSSRSRWPLPFFCASSRSSFVESGEFPLYPMGLFDALDFLGRYGQKHRHIVAELQKKKDATAKKGQTVANPDPNASEKQRLLQLDPTVVGSASGTLGSPKEFTNETYPSSSRPNPLTGGFNRDQRDAPPSLPSKDNRAPYNNRDTSPTQRSGGNSRDRDQAPYENAPRFSPSQGQYPYDSQHPDMIPLQEQQPRVVVRTIREDPTPGSDYPQQYTEPSARFVPIPVQVERSGPQQRFAAPPYHSDPYYRHGNSWTVNSHIHKGLKTIFRLAFVCIIN